MDKTIALWTSIISFFTAIATSCAPKSEQPLPPISSQQQNSAPAPQTTHVEVNVTQPSVQPPPTINAYRDSNGGHRLVPEKNFTGSEAVSSAINDPDVLLKIAIENSILIDEYLTKINATFQFEKDANKANLSKVVDWTSFIAAYENFLEQKSSSNSNISRALYHIKNLAIYRKNFNELPD